MAADDLFYQLLCNQWSCLICSGKHLGPFCQIIHKDHCLLVPALCLSQMKYIHSPCQMALQLVRVSGGLAGGPTLSDVHMRQARHQLQHPFSSMATSSAYSGYCVVVFFPLIVGLRRVPDVFPGRVCGNCWWRGQSIIYMLSLSI